MCVLFLNVMELLSCCGGRLCARTCIAVPVGYLCFVCDPMVFYVFLPDICLASPVIIEFVMLVMYCMQFVMSVSVVSIGVMILGDMYMMAMVMSLKCFVCILRSCMSVSMTCISCFICCSAFFHKVCVHLIHIIQSFFACLDITGFYETK